MATTVERYFVICDHEGSFYTYRFDLPKNHELDQRALKLVAQGVLYEEDWTQVNFAIGKEENGTTTILYEYGELGNEVSPVEQSMWLENVELGS